MKTNLLQHLRCPKSGQVLTLEALEPASQEDSNPELEIMDGWLVSESGANRYPIRNGIPRFVPESNYADNFGMQWNHFAKTQLDSHSGHRISADRFWEATAWNSAEMNGKWVLDVGCGSGRFAEVALSSGAQVVALDYSSAVDACYTNLHHHPNLHVIQGDIYSLPFAPNSFSFVYSLGVLQHTPDVAKAFASLPPIVRGGASMRRLLRKIFEKPIAPKILVTSLYQEHAQTEVVLPARGDRANFASHKPCAGTNSRRRKTPKARDTCCQL
jgi:ubiquinone/menaquinone biosynthesis C-methylase UbiE/uncharacterized protein YbaR (Trm112 family)